MIVNKGYRLLIFFLCLASGTYAQALKNDLIYHVYDALVSRDNTGLFNGTEFGDLNVDAWDNSHIYLISSDIMNGNLVYNNQFYANVAMKYDILDDNLIIRSKDKLSHFQIKLIAANLSKFNIHNRNFTRLTDPKLNVGGNGFFEEAFLGETVSLYIKHQKKRKRQTVNNVLQYRFEQNNFYVLKYKGVYSSIHAMKDFKSAMPDWYRKIRMFQKQNKPLYKKNRDQFMIALATYLDKNE